MSYKPAGLSLVWDFALNRGLFQVTAKVLIWTWIGLLAISAAAAALVFFNRISPGEAFLVILLASGLAVIWFQGKWSSILNQKMLQQNFALQHISQLGFKYPLPFGRWSVSPDFAEVLMTLMLERRPKVVLELGSGTSTALLGYCRRVLSDCQVLSIDHETRFAERTRLMLEVHDVAEGVTVRAAPLKATTLKVNGRRVVFQWYDLVGLLGSLPPIDLLIVDGPPGKIQPLSRYPALPILAGYLSPSAVVILDDGGRAEEKEIAKMWARQNSDFDLSFVGTFDGAWILTKEGSEWVA